MTAFLPWVKTPQEVLRRRYKRPLPSEKVVSNEADLRRRYSILRNHHSRCHLKASMLVPAMEQDCQVPRDYRKQENGPVRNRIETLVPVDRLGHRTWTQPYNIGANAFLSLESLQLRSGLTY
jgi:hypothetical protein